MLSDEKLIELGAYLSSSNLKTESKRSIGLRAWSWISNEIRENNQIYKTILGFLGDKDEANNLTKLILNSMNLYELRKCPTCGGKLYYTTNNVLPPAFKFCCNTTTCKVQYNISADTLEEATIIMNNLPFRS